MVNDWMIMSMRWYYVFELQPPTNLLFIPKMIYKHGEPWWNDTDKGILLICPLELSNNPTSSHLVASRRNGRRKWSIWPCEVLSFILPKWFFTCHKILWHGASGFTSPPKEDMLRIFITLKNPSPRTGLNPQTLGTIASTLTTRPLKRHVQCSWVRETERERLNI
jgi:hypothetical protein